MTTTQQATTTATRPATQPRLPHGLDPSDLIARLVDPSLRIEDIASDLGVTVSQLLDAAEHPLVTSILDRMDRLDRRRARRAQAAAQPTAAQTLELICYDRAATPETRRKAATKLLAAPRTTKASAVVSTKSMPRQTSSAAHPHNRTPKLSKAKARVSPTSPPEGEVDPPRGSGEGHQPPAAQRRSNLPPSPLGRGPGGVSVTRRAAALLSASLSLWGRGPG
ncbi:MAG: hypothetical protein H6814_06680 [Phycisphaeraceae bacterium]|nr:hypothetical protein [Phycisphaeraceae bacterium]